MKLFALGLGMLLLSGCASYGVVDNKAMLAGASEPSYSIKTGGNKGSGEISLFLAFSGGGTRAAALTYGVLQELRDTTVVIDGVPHRVLDEIDVISSVSGGSFTSAYYGLFGERIFEDYENVFLRRNIQSELLHSLFNPLHWFSRKGRTEMAVNLYQDAVFHGKTFADLQRQEGPLILINASDLGYGVRFSFVQEYFDLLCSDISSFPVARAVTASSAVPVLFNPVVVKNYPDCEAEKPDWLVAAQNRAEDNLELVEVIDGIESYSQKDQRQYAHFVDGGITDNLGLRAFYEIIEVAGGVRTLLKHMNRKPPRRLVVISIDASTEPEPEMDKTNKQPSLEETINAMSSAQLHLYNAATLELMQESIPRWARELSTPEQTVEPYFIQLGFKDIKQPEKLKFFNLIPTSFSLSGEQVERLKSAGRELLRSNPDFQRFVAELGGTQPSAQ